MPSRLLHAQASETMLRDRNSRVGYTHVRVSVSSAQSVIPQTMSAFAKPFDGVSERVLLCISWSTKVPRLVQRREPRGIPSGRSADHAQTTS